MEKANRVLTVDVLSALTYWPGVVGGERVDPPDVAAVLCPFFDEVLRELPWWNPDWRVTHVEPARPHEVRSDHRGHAARFTEVSVPGTVGPGGGADLPFVGQVGFAGDELIEFRAKVGDAVVGPATTPAGQHEPHPFGRTLRGLMRRRGIVVLEMARGAALSQSTVRGLGGGWHNPTPMLTRGVAEALGMPEEDVMIIAGLDPGGR
ncbi:XRE family transcriptional regulator [Kitasatospora sp. NPDC088391]|uniref:XRE family transcriptional regulator n=1 Tax=Kitasatospora sp. NPDC088391 TaxID=3364074 RepID=UPI00382E6DBC